MQKANAFKKLLLVSMLGATLLNVAPAMVLGGAMSVSAIRWYPSGEHQGMPVAADGRPKFMIESIDLLNNGIAFEYLDDGGMAIAPKVAGVAWFNSEENVQDTNQMESVSEIWAIGSTVLSVTLANGDIIEHEGEVTRYIFQSLNQDLGGNDPTGKWMYLLRFDRASGNNIFWNGQIDYSQCLSEYRNEANDESKRLTKGVCRASYDGSGAVSYSLEVEYEEVGAGAGGAGETGEGGNDGGEGGSEGGGEGGGYDEGHDGEGEEQGGGESGEGSGGEWNEEAVGDLSGEDWAEAVRGLGVTLTSYKGNEVEILKRSEGGDSEWSGVGSEGVNEVDDKVEDEKGASDESDNSEASGVEGDVVEVPELGGEEKGKMQWWMVPVMILLALGVAVWWIFPIVGRRSEDEEN